MSGLLCFRMEHFPIIVVIGVIAMDTVASWLVLHDDLAERDQKILQLLVVWLIPLLGAIGVFAIHRSHKHAPGKYRDPSDAGEDFFRDPARTPQNPRGQDSPD